VTTNWRGSTSADSHQRLRIHVKLEGVWKQRSTGLPDTPANRTKAAQYLAEVVAKLKARDTVMGADAGPVTVRSWAKRWLESRTAPTP
jgi:hypothetical protein